MIDSVQWQDNSREVLIAIIEGTLVLVPDNMNNLERKQIQQWLQIDGNVIQDPPIIKIAIPASISARQFYQQLSIQFPTMITQDEAYAAATSGALPDFILAMIKQIPQEQQFDAKMKIGSVVELQRNNQTTELFAMLMGWTDAQTDQFFIAANALL